MIRVIYAVCGLMLAGVTAQAVPATNGLYAAFQTTKGTFYCVLRYDLAPRTVANFVSLADGSKAWLDYSQAQVVQRPFYNGLTFHRVRYNEFIQTGSPNGLGTDDPGYQFRDEINASQTFNDAGLLGMANRAATNSNGAQFFITLAPQPVFNGNHTFFGQVVEGMDVVNAIGAVRTDSSDRPIAPVTITNVAILRIGTAAANFNAAAVTPALPVPQLKNSQFLMLDSSPLVLWDYLDNYEYRLCFSPDLKHWDGFVVGPYSGSFVDDFFDAFPSLFFKTVETKMD